MNKFENKIGKATNKIVSRLGWLMAVGLASVVAGCGSGGGDAILGATGVNAPVLAVGAVCPISGPTIPVLSSSDPSNGNQFATTSTTGVANSGKSITATFSLPLTASSITATSFTVTPAGGVALVPASFTYAPSTYVSTFTTSSALLPNTNYTAVVTTAITSSTGVPMACSYSWSFKTAATATVGAAQVNLATATPFAIAATAGVTNTASVTQINGDVVLDPLATCNAVAVDAAGGFGLCGGSAPTLNGKVISHLYDPVNSRSVIKADLLAAFLSITPPAGPPAAGSLGGATAIVAPTTLGTGSTGQSTFFPGVYQSITSIMIWGDLTLDAQGNPDAVFVFQSSSTIGTQVNARILLIGGAKASNVWWQAGSSTTLQANSQFQGNVLNSADFTMVTGATSCGRLFAGAFTSGAFTFDSNVVSVPGSPGAPASCK